MKPLIISTNSIKNHYFYPVKKNNVLYWIVQLVGWGFFSGMIAIATYLQGDVNGRTFYKIVEIYVLLLFISHGIRTILIKKDWINLKLGPLIPRSIGLVLIASVLLLTINNVTGILLFKDHWLSPLPFLINVLLYSIFLILWTAVYLSYHLLRKSRVQELYNLKLQATQKESELKTLRDQLNPHFLFNSLNSIRALVEVDPKIAKTSITTLSNLLRLSLLLGKKPFISLSEEFNLIQEYLKLEKIRFEDRLTYSVSNEVKEPCEIPPFLLQSMVENAIKHGISKLRKGGTIEIHTYFDNDELKLQVTNTGTYNPSKSKGIGIYNTKRRLYIIFGKDGASFTIKNEGNKVKALIVISKLKLKERTNESTHNRR